MGDLLSTPSQPDSTSSPAAAAAAASPAMSPSIPTKPNQPESTQQRQSPDSRTPIHETSDLPPDTKTAANQENPEEKATLFEQHSEESTNDGDGDAEEEEEEAGECGFCLFMKGGGCKETFTEWENCIEAAEKKEEDVVEKCFQATAALKKCMEAHSDYYAPILQAEKSLEEEAVKQLEEEKEKEKLNGEGGGGGGGLESEEKKKEEALGGNDSKKQS